jgi:hypothetical protein
MAIGRCCCCFSRPLLLLLLLMAAGVPALQLPQLAHHLCPAGIVKLLRLGRLSGFLSCINLCLDSKEASHS